MISRFGKEEIKAVNETIKNSSLLSGYTNKFLGGESLQKFENRFAKFHNCRFGIAVNSGTSALFVALRASKIKNKQKVLAPCITFTATTSQILSAGAIPHFCDINPDSYCMNVSNLDKSAKLAIPVHLLGHPCNFEMIKAMKEKNIFVIEDCAQAMGSKYKGKSVGSIGDCGIFSFQETKHITTLGEGGMILTNNEEFAEKCRRIRNHGEYYKNDLTVGYNFRMTETQAAFGLIQLKKLPKILKTFQTNANYIRKKLPDFIIPPKIPSTVNHSFLILGCKFDTNSTKFSRHDFLDKLTKNRKKILSNETKSDIKGINFRPGKIISSGYSSVQYKIPLYRKYSPKNQCVEGENFVKNSIFLDIHRWRSKKEIDEELSILEKTAKSI